MPLIIKRGDVVIFVLSFDLHQALDIVILVLTVRLIMSRWERVGCRITLLMIRQLVHQSPLSRGPV
jgi:hypothetical protein